MVKWEVLLPILGSGAIIGALLGSLSSLFLARHRHRVERESKIVDEFFSVRRSLCEVLSKLANLEVDGALDEEFLLQTRVELSNIYFLNYDLLPFPVLREMDCLYACLRDPGHRLYGCAKDCLIPLLKKEIIDMIRKCSILKNFEVYASMVLLNTGYARAQQAISINLQARKVLLTLNQYFTIGHLMNPASILKKPLHSRSGVRFLRRQWGIQPVDSGA